MDVGDVEDDGANDDKAEATEARQDEEQATDNFKDLDEFEITRAVHRADEGGSRRTFRQG